MNKQAEETEHRLKVYVKFLWKHADFEVLTRRRIDKCLNWFLWEKCITFTDFRQHEFQAYFYSLMLRSHHEVYMWFERAEFTHMSLHIIIKPPNKRPLLGSASLWTQWKTLPVCLHIINKSKVPYKNRSIP